jgi:outer membrane protein assembly factor BamB
MPLNTFGGESTIMAGKLVRILLWTVLASALNVAFAADWPHYLGPDYDGMSRESGLLKTWPEDGPKVLWETPIGIGYSSFAVADGRAFTMFQDDGGQYVVALDEKDGHELWRYQTGPIFTDYTNHNGPRATPTVDGDLVYAIDGSGVTVCLQAADKKEIWKKNILELAGAENATWGISQSPFISGDVVIVNPGGDQDSAFMALNKKTGDVIWKSGKGVSGYATPVAFKSGGVEQFVILTNESLVGVAAKDGKVLWSHPWKNQSDVNAANPIVLDDMIFISSGYGMGSAVIQVDLAATPPVKEVWRSRTLMCHFGTPLLIDGCLYGTNNARVVCADFKTGAVKWQDTARVLPSKPQITRADGLFYLLGEKGTLALAKMDPEKCEKVSEVAIMPGNDRWAVPVVANGRLFLRDDKKAYCLDIKAQ